MVCVKTTCVYVCQSNVTGKPALIRKCSFPLLPFFLPIYLSLWKLTSEHIKYLLLGASKEAALTTTTCVGALWMVTHCFPQYSLVDSTGSCILHCLLILAIASPSSGKLFFFYCNYLFLIEAENVDPCLSEHDSRLQIIFTWPCAHLPKLPGTA